MGGENGKAISLKNIIAVVSLLVVFSSIVAAFTLTKRDTQDNRQSILKLENNNQREHDIMCAAMKEQSKALTEASKEFARAINEQSVALGEIKTELRYLRRGR
jgi:hypothetical protein